MTSMEPTPFCQVCRNDNHETSQFQQIKNIAWFIRTSDMNISYWLNRQIGADCVQSRRQPRYPQGRSFRAGWRTTVGARRSSETPHIRSGEQNCEQGRRNFAGRSGPTPSNKNYRNKSHAARSSPPPSNIPDPKN